MFTDGSTQEKTVSYSQENIGINDIPGTPWINAQLNWNDLIKVEFSTPTGQVLMDNFIIGN